MKYLRNVPSWNFLFLYMLAGNVDRRWSPPLTLIVTIIAPIIIVLLIAIITIIITTITIIIMLADNVDRRRTSYNNT